MSSHMDLVLKLAPDADAPMRYIEDHPAAAVRPKKMEELRCPHNLTRTPSASFHLSISLFKANRTADQIKLASLMALLAEAQPMVVFGTTSRLKMLQHISDSIGGVCLRSFEPLAAGNKEGPIEGVGEVDAPRFIPQKAPLSHVNLKQVARIRRENNR